MTCYSGSTQETTHSIQLTRQLSYFMFGFRAELETSLLLVSYQGHSMGCNTVDSKLCHNMCSHPSVTSTIIICSGGDDQSLTTALCQIRVTRFGMEVRITLHDANDI